MIRNTFDIHPTNSPERVGTAIEMFCDNKTVNQPTIWGLTPQELHDRYWAARGVQVVRPNDNHPVTDKAELYLLVGSRGIVLFQLRDLIDSLSWLQPEAMFVRIHDERDAGRRDRVVTDSRGLFSRIERVYGSAGLRSERVVLTSSMDLAKIWNQMPSAAQAWRRLRQIVPRDKWCGATTKGGVYSQDDDTDVMTFVKQLIVTWKQPDASITGTRHVQRDVWANSKSSVAPKTRFVGPAWIGEGRELTGDQTVVGPAVLWDAPDTQPSVRQVPWGEFQPTEVRRPRSRERRRVTARPGKRLFDIVFSLIALAITLPLYPFIILAIMIENGWPVFFVHERETQGGRTFGCVKFRSMQRRAEAMKAQLVTQNKADGPQFFIENDPRLTRVGRFLRQTNLDELPQFINVLLGHMSIVGPRPSPYRENQFCPAWREARLSTRPGITGLWQVMRSREAGLDFQEWIRYDTAYVENMSFKLDLWIIWKTIGVVIRGVIRG